MTHNLFAFMNTEDDTFMKLKRSSFREVSQAMRVWQGGDITDDEYKKKIESFGWSVEDFELEEKAKLVGRYF